MGVELYALDREARRTLRVGDTRHEVGIVRRLWKATATDIRPEREETLEALADEQATRVVETPRAVIVDAATDFELDGRAVQGRRVLGWDAGRLVTQDLDWASHFEADCCLEDGREVVVLGESESGELPGVGWFAMRTTSRAARYSLTDQLAANR